MLHVNNQRKLIKRACAVGTVGVLAAGMITTKPLTAFTLDETAAVEEVPVDVAALEEQEDELLESEISVPEEPVQDPSTTDSVDPSATTPQPEQPQDPAVTEPQQPEQPDQTGDNPDNPDGSGDAANPNNPDGSGDAANPENPTNPTNPDESGDAANPDNPVNPDGSGDAANPVNPDGSGDAASPDNPVNPDGSGDAANPENPDGSGDITNPENPDGSGDETNPDDENNPANPDNPDNPGNSDDLDNAGDAEDPDGSSDETNSDDAEDPDESGSAAEEPDMNEEVPDWILPEDMEPGRVGNAAYILSQKLVKLPKIVEDFRFWTVTRKYAFAREDLLISEEIQKEGKEDEVRAIGRLQKDGLLYVLKEEDNGWFYVESGRVRGFVRSSEVITGEEAVPQLEACQQAAREAAEQAEQEYTGIERTVPMAEELVPWGENQAFTYLRATVGQTVIEKDYAVAGEKPVEVREGKSLENRIVGEIPAGGLCYILQDKDQEWIYIESGDVRGFVEKEAIQYGEEITKQVEEAKEDSFAQAEKKVEPQENAACYYTLTSIKSGIPGGELRKSVVEFASQFIGNPYVWGGTSLTDGADCSGFVQSIMNQYGYDLPRVACDQAEYGTKIPVEDALPGDLIFYAKDGYIYHVVMYAGEGKTIEAQSSRTGIVCTEVNTDRAVWATRFLKDNDYGYAGGGIGDVNATPDMYGTYLGNYQITYYCACEICCDVETGITATGAPVVEGRTIAVDPTVIPYGTEVIIGGHIFTAEDCGGAIKGNHIDIYVNDHAEALALGVNSADVYLKK